MGYRNVEEIHDRFWASRRRRDGAIWWLLIIPVFLICFHMGKKIDTKIKANDNQIASLLLPVGPLVSPVRRAQKGRQTATSAMVAKSAHGKTAKKR